MTQQHNAEMVLWAVNEYIKRSEARKERWGKADKYLIREVCDDLSIFDWWNDYLSLSQLKQMKSFLQTAIGMGYTGYVCFKVGAAGCSHGMWAHKKESETGYSPDGECIYHSFRSGDNYWDVKLPNGEWLGNVNKFQFTLKEVKEALAA